MARFVPAFVRDDTPQQIGIKGTPVAAPNSRGFRNALASKREAAAQRRTESNGFETRARPL